MKSLLIICDGMADRLTGGTTPLESAKTPNMDKLAKQGICGIMDTVKTGIRPGSDTAHLSLFGYDPYIDYTGRGPFEAAGAGLKLEKGDVALRCNFASVVDGKVVDRRAGREEYGLKELAEEIDGMEIEINEEEKDKFVNKIKNYNELVIHIDGASSGNPGPSGIGIVINDKNGNLVKECSEYIGKATNQVAELTAAIKTLEYFTLEYIPKWNSTPKLVIYSDSDYVVKGINGWIENWKVNGWKNYAKKPVANIELWKRLDNLNAKLNVNWVQIEGHSGDKGNERADRLAKEAIKNKNKNLDNSNSLKLTNEKIKVIFRKCSGHRGVVVFRGEGLSANISDADPEKEQELIHESMPLDGTMEAKRTAQILNKFTEKSFEILNNHKINKQRIAAGKLPANALLARGAGIKKEVASFEEKYGFRGAAVAAVDLIIGICRSIDLDIIVVPGATGHDDSNIKGKAEAAVSALKDYDFVFLHIKGTDEASHDGSFEKKKEMIERIDKEVIGTIIEKAEMKNLNLILTADHTTPVSLKKHTADPVPVLIHGDVRCDLVEKYDERSCARGDLGRICGLDLLNILFDLSDKQELFGA